MHCYAGRNGSYSYVRNSEGMKISERDERDTGVAPLPVRVDRRILPRSFLSFVLHTSIGESLIDDDGSKSDRVSRISLITSGRANRIFADEFANTVQTFHASVQILSRIIN